MALMLACFIGRNFIKNIDGLHQASGIPDELIIELHGNATYATCLDCGSRYELQSIKKAFLEDQTLPVCEDCSGLVKTATISFGQPMPKQKLFAAQQGAATGIGQFVRQRTIHQL